MENNLSICAEDVGIGDRQEAFIQIQLILDALVPAYVNIATQQMRCGLYRSQHGCFGNNVCKNFALVVIFDGHIASIFAANGSGYFASCGIVETKKATV